MLNGLIVTGSTPDTITVVGPDGAERTLARASLDPDVEQELSARAGLPDNPSLTRPMIGSTSNEGIPQIGAPPIAPNPQAMIRIPTSARTPMAQPSRRSIPPAMMDESLPDMPAAPMPQGPMTVSAPTISPEDNEMVANPEPLAIQPQAARRAPTRQSTALGQRSGSGIGGVSTYKQTPTTFEGLEAEVQRTMEDVAEIKQRGMEDQAYIEAKRGLLAQDRAAEQDRYLGQITDLAQRQRDSVIRDAANIDALEKEFRDTPITDFWASRGTGAKVMATIGVALGAYASTVTGTPNQALQIVNQAIQNDLDLQRMRLQKQRLSIEDAKGSLARTRQMFSDEGVAMNVAHVVAEQKVSSYLDEIAAESKSAAYAQNALEIGAQLKADIAARKEQIYVAQQQALAQSTKSQMSASAKALQDQFVTAQQKAGITTPEEVTRQKAWDRAVNIGSEQYIAPRPSEAGEARTAIISLQQFIKNTDEIAQYLDKSTTLDRFGNKIYTGAEGARAQALVDQAIMNRAKVYDPTGRVTEADMEIGRELFGNPATEWRNPDAMKAKLIAERKAAEDRIRTMTSNFLRVTGGRQNTQPIRVGAPVFPTE